MTFLRDFGLPELLICAWPIIIAAVVVIVVVLLVRKNKSGTTKPVDKQPRDDKPEAQ